jgi:hypothetical protein
MRAYITSLLVIGSLAPFTLTSRTAADVDRVEVTRIRAHFDSVLVELGARDVSALSRAQVANRAALIATLATYRDRGRFPRNYDFPGQAVPYFVDRKTGVLCAVAHLLESTGRRDIVDRVAATDNNIWVPRLDGDSAFTQWLDVNGLTLEEAARIQVPYVSSPQASGTALAQVTTVGLALGTSIWNATSNRRGEVPFVSVLGIITGVASASLAVGGAGEEGMPAGVSVLGFGAGSASALVGTASLMQRHRIAVARRDAERRAKEDRDRVRVDVSPTFSLVGQKTAGMALHVSF